MKKVHRDTLGWKAGVQANDRIVQVSQSSMDGMDGGRAMGHGARLWVRFLLCRIVMQFVQH